MMYAQTGCEELIVPVAVVQHVGLAPDRAQFSEVPEQHAAVMKRYSMNFEMVVIDISKIARLAPAAGDPISATAHSMANVIDAPESIIDVIVGLIDDLAHRKETFVLLCDYICGYNPHITIDHILNAKTKNQEGKQMVLSAVEQLREQGRVEGR
jgi:hypothetical protein